MLRNVILDNFIHFQGHQTFHFKPGCNLFIGVNGSGKTALFEAVRRCTGLSKNASVSRPHFRNKTSAASCIFKTEHGSSAEVMPMLFSSMIRLSSKDSSNPEVFVKLAFNTAENIVGLDLVKETGEARTLVNSEVHLPNEDVIKLLIQDCLQAVMETNDSSLSFQKLFNEIEKCVKEDVDGFLQDKDSTTVTKSTCDDLLQTYIDDKTVFTFSVRGIGVCQWSLSEKMRTEYKHENYIEVQKRAEILQWYFLSIKHGKINDEEQNKVTNYFNTITDHCGYVFHIHEETGEVYYVNKKVRRRSTDVEDSKEIQKRLSKVPEGIIEAMNSSIILGVTGFRSVFLEDPEKGMHPQMIVRMRDLLLRKMSEDQKTVVISSHHPSFLAPWTIPRLFIFKPSENEGGVSFRVIPADQIGIFQSDRKLSRVITSDRFSSLFYANRIFFVEGDSDEFFLTTLRLLLIDEMDEAFLNLLQPTTASDVSGATSELITKTNPATFREFVSSIQILNMSGETFKERMYKLCKELEIETMFLHDFDVLSSDKDSSKLCLFLKSFNLQKKYTNERAVLDNVSTLEDDGFFVWKNGKLETVVKDLADNHESLKKCLIENHCERVAKSSSSKAGKKSRDKLFLADNVTEDNITKVVKAILECCKEDLMKGRITEMIRLIQFLKKSSMKTTRHVRPESSR